MLIRVADLIAAEAAYDEAAEARKAYESDPSAWSGYEEYQDHVRTLNLTPSHFERLESLRAAEERALQALDSLKRRWLPN